MPVLLKMAFGCGVGVLVLTLIGFWCAHRGWEYATRLIAVVVIVALGVFMRVTYSAASADTLGHPLTKSNVKLGVVYDIVGGMDLDYPASGLRTYVVIRERYGDPKDVRLFEYPGRPVGHAFTVEKDSHGIPEVRYAPDGH